MSNRGKRRPEPDAGSGSATSNAGGVLRGRKRQPVGSGAYAEVALFEASERRALLQNDEWRDPIEGDLWKCDLTNPKHWRTPRYGGYFCEDTNRYYPYSELDDVWVDKEIVWRREPHCRTSWRAKEYPGVFCELTDRYIPDFQDPAGDVWQEGDILWRRESNCRNHWRAVEFHGVYCEDTDIFIDDPPAVEDLGLEIEDPDVWKDGKILWRRDLNVRTSWRADQHPGGYYCEVAGCFVADPPADDGYGLAVRDQSDRLWTRSQPSYKLWCAPHQDVPGALLWKTLVELLKPEPDQVGIKQQDEWSRWIHDREAKASENSPLVRFQCGAKWTRADPTKWWHAPDPLVPSGLMWQHPNFGDGVEDGGEGPEPLREEDDPPICVV